MTRTRYSPGPPPLSEEGLLPPGYRPEVFQGRQVWLFTRRRRRAALQEDPGGAQERREVPQMWRAGPHEGAVQGKCFDYAGEHRRRKDADDKDKRLPTKTPWRC